MKASELRLGNWVILSVAGTRHYGKIYTLTPTHLLIGDGVKCDYSDLEPVPLTAEIMEKSVFVSCSGAMFSSKIGTLFLKQPFVGAGHWLVKTTSLDKITSIKSLHELQNFYFSITGEEMEVSL